MLLLHASKSVLRHVNKTGREWKNKSSILCTQIPHLPQSVGARTPKIESPPLNSIARERMRNPIFIYSPPPPPPSDLHSGFILRNARRLFAYTNVRGYIKMWYSLGSWRHAKQRQACNECTHARILELLLRHQIRTKRKGERQKDTLSRGFPTKRHLWKNTLRILRQCVLFWITFCRNVETIVWTSPAIAQMSYHNYQSPTLAALQQASLLGERPSHDDIVCILVSLPVITFGGADCFGKQTRFPLAWYQNGRQCLHERDWIGQYDTWKKGSQS